MVKHLFKYCLLWLAFWFYAIPSFITVLWTAAFQLYECLRRYCIVPALLLAFSLFLTVLCMQCIVFIFPSPITFSYSHSHTPCVFAVSKKITSLFFGMKLEKGGNSNNERNGQMYENKQIFKNFRLKILS